MKKRFSIAIFVFLLAGYAHKFRPMLSAPVSPSIVSQPAVEPTPNPTPVPSPAAALSQFKVEAATIVPDNPVRVVIPTIGLNARILPVALTAAQIVDTPPSDVGWYQHGAKPGEPGTATFNGHYQNGNGQPGVFHHLSRLKSGDRITVTDRQNQQFNYRVIAVDLVDTVGFPTQKVYGHTAKPLLNLITCAGAFSRTRQDYTKRTVVYSELAE